MRQTKFVLLDRDGVINHDSEQFIKTPDEWLPIPGSLEAIALLCRHGYQVFVITNQSGLGRGLFTLDTLNAMHKKMRQLVQEQGGKISGIYFCPHLADDHCDCRKPKPGLIKQFAREHRAELSSTYLIGDSLRDIQAAESAGAKGILVKTGKGKKTINANPTLTNLIFEDLYHAAKFITSSQ